MNWFNVKRLFVRELLGQLRDRRTIFTTVLLPVMIYPVLGLVMMQAAQFINETSSKVVVVGDFQLSGLPTLLSEEQKTGDQYVVPESMLEIVPEQYPEQATVDGVKESLRQRLDTKEFDAALILSPEFREYMSYLQSVVQGKSVLKPQPDQLPGPVIVYNSVVDKSKIARGRLSGVLEAWEEEVRDRLFELGELPLGVATPIAFEAEDMAPEESQAAEFWASMIPIMLLLWTLSGAFYPAVDLCAGEKERGTLETLLCGPAKRVEIVTGKLLTVMVFSFATSLANLVAIAFTGVYMVAKVMPVGSELHNKLGVFPGWSILWSLVVLVPLVAMFSALALAAATFARSSKEGQYYMMPLLMLALPLSMISVMPNVELNLGTSLIPVAGSALLLRNLVESQFDVAVQYAIPVMASSAFCCYLAIRWATFQFNSEAVLFRESEKWDIRLWLRQLFRNKPELPTGGMAIFLAIGILMLRYIANSTASVPEDWADFVTGNSVALILTVGLPAIILASLLTRSPMQSLNLNRFPPVVLLIAVVLPFVMHPVVLWMGVGVEKLYPISPGMVAATAPLEQMMTAAPAWAMLLAIAVVPGIFEELAFRGVILTGLRKNASASSAIFVSAAFFGITHGILQQSINAFAMGLLLGYVAIRTGSLVPTIVMHVLHNGLTYLLSIHAENEQLSILLTEYNGQMMYSPMVAGVGGTLAVGLLFILHLKTRPPEPDLLSEQVLNVE
ncbi:MAG: ABC transporter permease subunit/CPBP intramembrane protease [Planctomycetaceae bacterium]